MAVYVYAENINGIYKKAAFEEVSYANSISDKPGATLKEIGRACLRERVVTSVCGSTIDTQTSNTPRQGLMN